MDIYLRVLAGGYLLGALVHAANLLGHGAVKRPQAPRVSVENRESRLMKMELESLVVPEVNAAEEAGRLLQDLPNL